MFLYHIFFLINLFFSLFLYFLGLYFLSYDLEIFVEYNLLSMNSSSLIFIFLFDWISLLFMSFVFFISSMIIKYSDEYMSGDKKMKRFLFLMILFVFSMMLMITSQNLISILLGWDGLGLVSYALVIYYQNEKSYNAGMLTALSNRLGDAALLISIAWMMDMGSWSFTHYLECLKNDDILLIVTFFVVLAAITKSAQIPFSSWLPAAMAAPTPVSSLVHSSTLVTAGVYLLIRFSYMIPSNVFTYLMYFSLLTMFMAGLGANFEFDLKKIIALSTLSQLGMMIFILCLGSKELAFFHLLIHALFKATLFMCAGAMIHNMGNCQDIRFMGGMVKFMPMTCTCFNISNLALCGLPFLSGFYSKDLVAEAVSMSFLSIFMYMVFFISVGLTVSYSMRLSFYTIFGECNIISNLNYLSDMNNKVMLKGMMGLVFLVIFEGSVLMWLLFSTPYFIILPFIMKMMTLLMISLGASLGLEMSKMMMNYSQKSLKFINFSLFFSGMWNMPIISTLGLSPYFLFLGKIYFKSMDSGWFEYYGSKNLYNLIYTSSNKLQLFSNNHLKLYLLVMISFILFFTILML
uniref:NADH-ubiquinone oxidoreductase chain 5 n=1 Tax=Niphades castanea TaxID=2027381 RepID=A0A6M4AD74_9CUCU|nr:NADH dehydrogenase subunit 5 [Niphades castanea]